MHNCAGTKNTALIIDDFSLSPKEHNEMKSKFGKIVYVWHIYSLSESSLVQFWKISDIIFFGACEYFTNNEKILLMIVAL